MFPKTHFQAIGSVEWAKNSQDLITRKESLEENPIHI